MGESAVLRRSGLKCVASTGEEGMDECYRGRCDGRIIPAGEEVWCSAGGYMLDDGEAYCRRCAFDYCVHDGQRFDAYFRRARPWVGLDLIVYRSIRKSRRKARQRWVRRRYA